MTARAGVRLATVLLTSFALAISVAPANAAHSRTHAARVRPHPYSAIPEKDAAIVEDGATGKVLYERNADAIRYPASLTKMMTLYLLFERLDAGKLTLDTPLMASTHAAEQAPTKVGIRPGETIPVETAIKALTVLSANDVAVVIAEAIGGSESHFAQMMTEKAHELGMMHTNYHNASGLPDLQQLTTARDLALLARHIAYDFPQYFGYFSAPGFTFDGRAYRTHDNLLGAFDGTDGIKTGYTQMSGFNLVSSVVRDNKHVIGVLMGGTTAATRDREMMRMLSATFDAAEASPTMLADANVPWDGGSGPAIQPFRKAPDTVEVAALDSQSPALETSPVPSPEIAVAELPPAAAAPTTAHAITVAGGSATVLTNGTTPLSALQAKVLPPADAAVARAALASAAPAESHSTSAPLQVEEGDAAGLSFLVPSAGRDAVKRWTVQIGAFASETIAQNQLARYAKKALDLLGVAKRFVVSFETPDGHTLYRARFGVFAEAEAREICQRMTKRGATCFAAEAN